MEDPRTLPVPEEALPRAIAFTKALAYRILVGDWTAAFYVPYITMDQWKWKPVGGSDAHSIFEKKLGPWKTKNPLALTLVLLGHIATYP